MNITDNQVEMISVDKFKMGKKWFWMGIVVAFLHVPAGFIYGIVLLLEKNHRREGIIIIAFTVVWALISYFVINPWLIDWMAAQGLTISGNIQQIRFPQQLQ